MDDETAEKVEHGTARVGFEYECVHCGEGLAVAVELDTTGAKPRWRAVVSHPPGPAPDHGIVLGGRVFALDDEDDPTGQLTPAPTPS